MAAESGERSGIHAEHASRESGPDEPEIRRRRNRRRISEYAERIVGLRLRPAESGRGNLVRPVRPADGGGLLPVYAGSGENADQPEATAAGPEQPEHAGGHNPHAADP